MWEREPKKKNPLKPVFKQKRKKRLAEWGMEQQVVWELSRTGRAQRKGNSA